MFRFRRSRGAVAAFNGGGKKNLQRLNPGLKRREQFSVYRVEGEIGRFRFRLYEAVDADGGVVSQGSGYFPARQPREWHKTEGFREEALCLEVAKRSYRTNAAHLNRYRRQVEGGTPVSTLQANAHQEGSQVLDFLERHSQSILQAHRFDAEGQPPAAQGAQAAATPYHRLSAERLEQGLTAVCEAMQAREFSPEHIAAMRTQAAGAVYEDPAQSTNVAIDDIEVKRQKAHRADPASEAPSPPRGKRPKVANTVARIDQGQKRFTVSGTGVGQVLRFVLRFCSTTACWAGGSSSSPMAIRACRIRLWPALPGIRG